MKEEKSETLKQYRAIVISTIDYLLSREKNLVFTDGENQLVYYYQQEKLKAEANYSARHLFKLKQQLKKLTRFLEHHIDFDYAIYIEEHTGYKIEPYKDFQSRVNDRIQLKKLTTTEEWEDTGTLLHYCEKSKAENHIIDKLKNLLADYFTTHLDELTKNNKHHRSKVVSRSVENNIEIVTVQISTGPKPRFEREEEILSPDGKRKIVIRQGTDRFGSTTTINILFLDSHTYTHIYVTKGIHDITVSWKDNATITIHTSQKQEPLASHKKIQLNEDCINVEYIEVNGE